MSASAGTSWLPSGRDRSTWEGTLRRGGLALTSGARLDGQPWTVALCRMAWYQQWRNGGLCRLSVQGAGIESRRCPSYLEKVTQDRAYLGRISDDGDELLDVSERARRGASISGSSVDHIQEPEQAHADAHENQDEHERQVGEVRRKLGQEDKARGKHQHAGGSKAPGAVAVRWPA